MLSETLSDGVYLKGTSGGGAVLLTPGLSVEH
jgi:hypothetical protein